MQIPGSLGIKDFFKTSSTVVPQKRPNGDETVSGSWVSKTAEVDPMVVSVKLCGENGPKMSGRSDGLTDASPSSSLTPLSTQLDGSSEEVTKSDPTLSHGPVSSRSSSLTPLPTQESADGLPVMRPPKEPAPVIEDQSVTSTLSILSSGLFSSSLPIGSAEKKDDTQQNFTESPHEGDHGKPVIGDQSERLINAEAAPTIRSSSHTNQRIVRKGETVIRNSDDEGDSDDSLEDLDVILYGKRKDADSISSGMPSYGYQAPQIKVEEVAKRYPRRGAPVLKKSRPKFSMADPVKQRQEYEDSKAAIERIGAVLKIKRERCSPDGDLGGDLVDQVLWKGGKDEVDRLKAALRRTEAVFRDESWSFFEDRKRQGYSTPPPFPSIEDKMLKQLLSRTSRHHSLISGFVEDMTWNKKLPPKLARWILYAAFQEAQGSLRQAYSGLARMHHLQMCELLTPGRLNAMLKELGASDIALEVESTIKPRAKIANTIEPKSSMLAVEALLELLRLLAPRLNIETRIHAIGLLCRLLLDRCTVQNCSFLMRVREVLTRLLMWPPDEDTKSRRNYMETILHRLYISTTSSAIRVQLLKNLPVSPPDWLVMRRQLALAMLLDDTQHLFLANLPSCSVSQITEYLRTHSAFSITNITDYASLTSLIATLDIAVDSADRPSAFPTPASERVFNNAIDDLATQVRSLFMSIIDSGASNMRRTETKEALEGFHSRLLYAVRTKPPPRKGLVFGGADDEDTTAMKRGMQFFLSKGTIDQNAEEIPS